MTQAIAKSQIEELVFAAIDELNSMREPDKQVKRQLDTVLTGPAAELDSMDVVNLIVETEQRIEESLDVHINLADQQSVSQTQDPLENIATFVDYIWITVNDQSAEPPL